MPKQAVLIRARWVKNTVVCCVHVPCGIAEVHVCPTIARTVSWRCYHQVGVVIRGRVQGSRCDGKAEPPVRIRSSERLVCCAIKGRGPPIQEGLPRVARIARVADDEIIVAVIVHIARRDRCSESDTVCWRMDYQIVSFVDGRTSVVDIDSTGMGVAVQVVGRRSNRDVH